MIVHQEGYEDLAKLIRKVCADLSQVRSMYIEAVLQKIIGSGEISEYCLSTYSGDEQKFEIKHFDTIVYSGRTPI